MISFREIAERMDPVRSPTRLAEPPCHGWTKPTQPYGCFGRRLSTVSSSATARKLESCIANRKGLQLHRWPREHSIAFSQPSLSLRAIADRHADPNWTFRFLWYNTWLLYPPLGIQSKPLARASPSGDR